jgi:excisionase family DNA binding protein
MPKRAVKKTGDQLPPTSAAGPTESPTARSEPAGEIPLALPSGAPPHLEHPDTWTTLLTVAQVAERMGISRAQVYVLLADGALTSVKIGRSRRVALGDLARYIALLRPPDAVAPSLDNGVNDTLGQAR